MSPQRNIIPRIIFISSDPLKPDKYITLKLSAQPDRLFAEYIRTLYASGIKYGFE